MLKREETAKVKLMYFYSDCTWVVPIGSNSEMKPITDKGIILDLIVSANGSVHPELQSLSAITDEHAVELYNLVWGDRNERLYKIDWTKRFLEHRDMKGWYMEFDVYTKLADKLRSWGYMLPYMGIDLFEAGIAIIKQ